MLTGHDTRLADSIQHVSMEMDSVVVNYIFGEEYKKIKIKTYAKMLS